MRACGRWCLLQWLCNHWPPKLVEEQTVECHEDGRWPLQAHSLTLQQRLVAWVGGLQATVG